MNSRSLTGSGAGNGRAGLRAPVDLDRTTFTRTLELLRVFPMGRRLAADFARMARDLGLFFLVIRRRFTFARFLGPPISPPSI